MSLLLFRVNLFRIGGLVEDERSAWQVNYVSLIDLLVTFLRDISPLRNIWTILLYSLLVVYVIKFVVYQYFNSWFYISCKVWRRYSDFVSLQSGLQVSLQSGWQGSFHSGLQVSLQSGLRSRQSGGQWAFQATYKGEPNWPTGEPLKWPTSEPQSGKQVSLQSGTGEPHDLRWASKVTYKWASKWHTSEPESGQQASLRSKVAYRWASRVDQLRLLA